MQGHLKCETLKMSLTYVAFKFLMRPKSLRNTSLTRFCDTPSKNSVIKNLNLTVQDMPCFTLLPSKRKESHMCRYVFTGMLSTKTQRNQLRENKDGSTPSWAKCSSNRGNFSPINSFNTSCKQDKCHTYILSGKVLVDIPDRLELQ